MSNWTENTGILDPNHPKYDPSTHQFKKGWIDGHPTGGYPPNYFFADSIRSVLIGFGNYFNNVFVIRYDEKGEPIKQIQVPLKYGARMKSHDFRVEQESGKKYYIQLPNMTYRIDSIAFASERYSGAGEPRGFYEKYFEVHGVDYVLANKFWSDVHPVPVNITISMEAKTEHISDATQILEQIMVRFAPEAYIDLKEFWFINKRRSIKMKCDSSNIEISQDFGEEDKREITATFTFTVEAWLYKPIQDASIIDKIVTTLGVNNNSNYWQENLQGNYDGSLMNRYDFNYQFGTKIGRVSALKPIEKQPKPISSLSGWDYEYEYDELPDITNYPVGSKLLLTKKIVNDSGSATWNGINQQLTALSSLAPVIWYDYTHTPSLRNGPALQYWQITANSGDMFNPTMEGNRIYQVYYDPNYVVSAGVINSDGTVVKPGTFGGTFILEYENLKGFGGYVDNLKFGTKDAQLNETIVKDAPWVSQVSTKNEELL